MKKFYQKLFSTSYFIIVFVFQGSYATVPQNFETHIKAANQYLSEGNYEQAHQEYDLAILCNPASAQVYFNKGLTFSKQKNHESAITHYKKALELNSTSIRIYNQLGHACKEAKRFDEALEYLKKVLEFDPRHRDALISIGDIYLEKNDITATLFYLQRALKLNPTLLPLLINYATSLILDNQLDKAFAILHRILDKNPNNQAALYNIAFIYTRKDKAFDAIHYFQQIIKLNPEHVGAHFGLALSYLKTGDFKNGWKEYEWRCKLPGKSNLSFKAPEWNGSDSLQGKTLLLYAEQGLGDELQFIRFAQCAKEQGATIIAAVHQQLITLIANCPYIDKVVPLYSNYPDYDYQLALMSMPLVCNVELDSISTKIPYLFPDEHLVEYWKNKLKSDTNFKIGICWQGNPTYRTSIASHFAGKRSLSIELFSSIAQIPGVSLYSLQKINGLNKFDSVEKLFVLHKFDDTFDSKYGRFIDTAAIMKNLDLIITVDTSICHLAGGLGVPVWLMLSNPADWRWFTGSPEAPFYSSSPWYPTMRIFRQKTTDDWEALIDQVAKELQSLLKKCS